MQSQDTTAALRGVVPPVLTPLTPERELDVPAFEALIEHQISGGVHGLFFLGSSGEVAYLTDQVRAQVLENATRIVAGRVPVLAGIIDITTNRVIEQAKAAQKAGVDAIVATAPMYIRTNDAEIEEHFRLIAAAVDVPLYAYDLPVCVYYKLNTEMLVRLGVDGVLAGVKDSSGDDVAFRRLVMQNKAAGSPMTILTGHEAVVDGMLLLGADGLVPGLGNVDPAGYVRLWNLAQAGDWAGARAEQDRLAELFEIVFQAQGLSGGAGGVGAFKTALQAMGIFNTNLMSLPAGQITGPAVDQIVAILEQTGMLTK